MIANVDHFVYVLKKNMRNWYVGKISPKDAIWHIVVSLFQGIPPPSYAFGGAISKGSRLPSTLYHYRCSMCLNKTNS